MKSSWLIIAGSLLLVVLTTTWWLDGRQTGTSVTPSPDPVPVAEILVPAAEPTMSEPETGSDSTLPTTENFARRLTHVPDNPPSRASDVLTTDWRDITAGNIEHLLQANLENTLKGELASAYFVVRARMACERFAGSRSDLERRIERTNKRVERDTERGRGVPDRRVNGLPMSVTEDTEANRANLENWYEACQRVQSMFSPDLRSQLEQLAMAGDVMARFLYASWPLDQLDVGEAFDQQYRWEGLARDFSQANLDRGEAAGLMAFSQSYQNGWFTQRNGDLALAFAIAALNCGFETTSTRKFLTNRIEHLSNAEDPADLQRLQFALQEAEHLGRFCVH